jgi:hypothetical protein
MFWNKLLARVASSRLIKANQGSVAPNVQLGQNRAEITGRNSEKMKFIGTAVAKQEIDCVVSATQYHLERNFNPPDFVSPLTFAKRVFRAVSEAR